jgi:hypothetical protein
MDARGRSKPSQEPDKHPMEAPSNLAAPAEYGRSVPDAVSEGVGVVGAAAGVSSRARREDRSTFRDYVRRLSEKRFWLSKWMVAAAVAVAALLVGIALLITRNVAFDTFLDYFALGLLIFVLVTLFYGIIAIHDVPYEIARHRDHPHQDAIHAAGWVSLFTLHAIWPFLWIWAMLYRPDRGWGFASGDGPAPGGVIAPQLSALRELERRVSALEHRSERGVH